jgi:hypothetical protein
MAVARGADAELALGGFVESADGDTRHDINDSIDVNDCLKSEIRLQK